MCFMFKHKFYDQFSFNLLFDAIKKRNWQLSPACGKCASRNSILQFHHMSTNPKMNHPLYCMCKGPAPYKNTLSPRCQDGVWESSSQYWVQCGAYKVTRISLQMVRCIRGAKNPAVNSVWGRRSSAPIHPNTSDLCQPSLWSRSLQGESRALPCPSLEGCSAGAETTADNSGWGTRQVSSYLIFIKIYSLHMDSH